MQNPSILNRIKHSSGPKEVFRPSAKINSVNGQLNLKMPLGFNVIM